MWLFRVASALSLLLLTPTYGQMVVYDTTTMDASVPFRIECKPGTYCLLEKNYGTFSFGPTSPVEIEEDDRFVTSDGLDGYHWLEEGAFIEGLDCNIESCNVTCDADSCICQIGSENCTVIESLPDSSVADPSDYLLYESSAQLPELLQLRCENPFGRCSPVFGSGNVFRYQTFLANSSDYYYAMGFSDCDPSGSVDVENETCLVECDPRCECVEGDPDGDNSTTSSSECTVHVIASEAPSMAPSTEPTGDMGTTTSVAKMLSPRFAPLALVATAVFAFS